MNLKVFFMFGCDNHGPGITNRIYRRKNNA